MFKLSLNLALLLATIVGVIAIFEDLDVAEKELPSDAKACLERMKSFMNKVSRYTDECTQSNPNGADVKACAGKKMKEDPEHSVLDTCGPIIQSSGKASIIQKLITRSVHLSPELTDCLELFNGIKAIMELARRKCKVDSSPLGCYEEKIAESGVDEAPVKQEVKNCKKLVATANLLQREAYAQRLKE